jgi:hypothetical protein
MLAQLTEQTDTDGAAGTGAVMVLCLEGDKHAEAAVAGVRRLLRTAIAGCTLSPSNG